MSVSFVSSMCKLSPRSFVLVVIAATLLVGQMSLSTEANAIAHNKNSGVVFQHQQQQQHFKAAPAAATKSKRPHDDDEMNNCIMACVKCAEEDMDDPREDESSRSVTCANECLITSSPKDVVIALLESGAVDKSFAKCFLKSVLHPEYMDK